MILLLFAGAAGWATLFVPLAAQARVPWQVYLMLGPWSAAALVAMLLAIAALCALPPMRFFWASPGRRLRGSSIGAAVFAAVYLALVAALQHRQFFPYVQDESSYLIQAHQLAHLHLWYRAHPLGKFFDSYQLLTDGVYASAYFPGTALLHAPGVWLGLPAWVTNLSAAAAVVGLLHWIVSDMIDSTAAWLAVALLLACQLFRSLSTMTLAQIPLLLYSLGAITCWMRWRDSQRPVARWPLSIGALLGLAAITRPVDALCFALPLAAAVLIDLSRRPRPLRVITLIAVGATPFLAIQLISNVGITGDLLTTPFRVYADRDYPGTAYGFHPVPADAQPISDLPQKRISYHNDVQPLVAAHRPGRLLSTLFKYRLPLTLSLGGAVTPFPLLAMFLPASLAAMQRGRWILLLTLPLFLLLYVPYAFFYPGYTLAAAPALVLSPLIAARVLPSVWPTARPALMAFGSLTILGLSIAAQPQWDPSINDDLFQAPLIRAVNQQLATVSQPAIVLFHFADHNLNEEPVYNADVAWPDNAPIIRAHDRGPQQNQQLFRYYAARQPNRLVYRFDEADNSLHRLDTVAKLAGPL